MTRFRPGRPKLAGTEDRARSKFGVSLLKLILLGMLVVIALGNEIAFADESGVSI